MNSKKRRGGGSAWTSHRSACPVSLAGDSLLRALSKYTCYSFPPRQRRRTRPDKAIYPSPAWPARDAITNVFPSAGDQYVGRRTNKAASARRALPRLAGRHRGALTADVHKRINKRRRSSRVNTGHNQTSGGSTVLRMISAAHMWINTRLPKPRRPESQVVRLLPGGTSIWPPTAGEDDGLKI